MNVNTFLYYVKGRDNRECSRTMSYAANIVDIRYVAQHLVARLRHAGHELIRISPFFVRNDAIDYISASNCTYIDLAVERAYNNNPYPIALERRMYAVRGEFLKPLPRSLSSSLPSSLTGSQSYRFTIFQSYHNGLSLCGLRLALTEAAFHADPRIDRVRIIGTTSDALTPPLDGLVSVENAVPSMIRAIASSSYEASTHYRIPPLTLLGCIPVPATQVRFSNDAANHLLAFRQHKSKRRKEPAPEIIHELEEI